MSGKDSKDGRKRKAEEGSEGNTTLKSASDGDWRNSKTSVGEGMLHSFQTGMYTDVSFKVGPTDSSTIINAHKYVLMIRSEVFTRMLTSRLTLIDSDNRNVINIPDHSPESFNVFLKYLYIDKLTNGIDVDTALEVLHLAHMYQVPGLITKCAQVIEGKIRLDCCVYIYQRTRLYTELRLSECALDFVKKNMSSLVSSDQFDYLDASIIADFLKKDDIAINEILIFKALYRWGSVESTAEDKTGETKPRKEVMQSLIAHIRFDLISPEDLAKEVVPTKVLSNDQALEIICSSVIQGNANKNQRIQTLPKPQFQVETEKPLIREFVFLKPNQIKPKTQQRRKSCLFYLSSPRNRK